MNKIWFLLENKKLDIRWQQRFENFQKASLLLKEALSNDINKLSLLEKEGVIQRVEYTFELAWKVLKNKNLIEHIDRIGITIYQQD